MWTSYKEMYDNIDNEKKLIEKRLELVRFANEHGIKFAARVYSCSKNTIKKWCRRYAVYGIKGLKDKSRRPHHSPKRIDNSDIIKIKECVDYAKQKKNILLLIMLERKLKSLNTQILPLIDILMNLVMEQKTKNIFNLKRMFLGNKKSNLLCIGK